MPDETLTIKITGDSKEYEKSVRDAEKATKGFSGMISDIGSKTAGGLASGLKVTAGAIAGVSAALGAGAVAGVKYNASIEQYQTSFEVMTGSAEKAAEVVEKLKKVGAETPFELPDLADVTQLLMNYGFTADEAMDSMMMLGDISQGSADKMQRVAAAYGQMSSAGKVSLEDVKQMIEAGFNPLQEISESTGESMDSLYERISSGTLAVDEITASMQRATSEGGKYYQSMQKQSQTVSGLISTLKDNAQQLVGEVVQPLSESLGTTLLPAAISSIEQLTAAFQTHGVEGLIQAGSQILTNLLLGISMALPNLINTAVQVIQTLIANISANLPQIMTAGSQILSALGNGILQLLPMIGMLALNIIITLVNGLTSNLPQMLSQASLMMSRYCAQIQASLPSILQNGVEIISNLLNGILQEAPGIIGQVSNMMASYLDTILGALPSILDSGSQIISNLLSGIEANAPQILSQVFDMMSSYIEEILSNLPAILESGVDLILNLLDGLVQTAPQIISQAGEMLVDFIAEIASYLPDILQTGIELIGELLAGIIDAVPDIIAAIPEIVGDMIDAFLDVDWASVGGDIISGIGEGLKNAAGNLAQSAINAASNALNGVKNFLGISSPSKVFRDEVGLFMAQGMGVGFVNNIPMDEIKSSLNTAVYDLSDYYSQIGQRINPVDAITGTASISQSYMADISNIFEGMVIQIDNVTNLDGKPIYEKSAQYTIQKIGNQQRAVRRAKGAVA